MRFKAHRTVITLVPQKISQPLTSVLHNEEHPLTMTEIVTKSRFQHLQEITPKTGIPGSLLFLGTGSALPSKYRNGLLYCLIVTASYSYASLSLHSPRLW